MPVAIIQKSTAKIAFAGNIRDKKLLDLITEAAVSSLTGILRLKTLHNEYNLYFVKGSLVYATNMKKPMEKMVFSIVKSSGFISREKLVLCEKQKSKLMKTVLEILIDDGYVSMLLYSKIISTAMRINVINAMLETDGDYSFEIRLKIDSVQGVKPISVAYLKPVDMMISENREEVKTVVGSLYSSIKDNSGATYLVLKNTFLHSAIASESDFLRFFVSAVGDFIEKKWTFQTFFEKDKILNYAAVYTFRILLTVCLVIFLYLSLMTTTFDLKTEEISGRDFYFIRNKITESFHNFQNVKKIRDSGAAAPSEKNGKDKKVKKNKK